MEEGLESIRRRPIASLQTVFNIIEQEPGLTFANEIKVRGAAIGMIARVPHASDTLSGKVTRDTVFPPEDHRSHRNRDNMLDNFDKADTLAFLWEGTGRTRGPGRGRRHPRQPGVHHRAPDQRRRRRRAGVRRGGRHAPHGRARRAQLDEMWRDNFGVENRYEMPLKSSH